LAEAGNSVIVGPNEEILAGPSRHEETILYAELDLASRLRLLTLTVLGSLWESRHDRLMQDIERFAAILCAHLDREEDALFPGYR
jgi:hypothetical protein